jgi:hypothetical protein
MIMSQSKVPDIDFKSLRPGSRLRMRDWRDKSLVDTTFFAFQAVRNIMYAPGAQAMSGHTFTSLRENYQARDTRLVVHRDGFCGLTWLLPGDVVELLPDPTDEKRLEFLVYFFEGEATHCPGCKAFVDDGNTKKPHRGDPYGPWCTGRAVIPEMIKILAESESNRTPP